MIISGKTTRREFGDGSINLLGEDSMSRNPNFLQKRECTVVSASPFTILYFLFCFLSVFIFVCYA